MLADIMRDQGQQSKGGKIGLDPLLREDDRGKWNLLTFGKDSDSQVGATIRNKADDFQFFSQVLR